MLTKAAVASGYAFQASHADFLPFPRNCDVVSHPVNAWKNSISEDLELGGWH